MKNKILQATLPQAHENAILAVEYLRGSLKYASPIEAIVILGLLDDAAKLEQRINALASAIREENE